MKMNLFILEGNFLEYKEITVGQNDYQIGVLDLIVDHKPTSIRASIRIPLHSSFKEVRRIAQSLEKGDEIIVKGSVNFRIYSEKSYAELTAYDIYYRPNVTVETKIVEEDLPW